MYYILSATSPAAGYMALISHRSDDPRRSWWSGERLAVAPPNPLRATLKMKGDSVLVEMWNSPLPLMTKRLHQILLDAGVANLDVYPAELTDPKSGRVFDHYVAFNLIGLVAAADLGQSVFRAPDGPLVSVDFDSLVIDANKTRGALMFRLAEAVNGIVVHESIRQAVEATDIDTLRFTDPKDWVG